MAKSQIKKVSWWHESIVDWTLANPSRSLTECAAYFGVTLSYLSVLRNSDAFRDYEARRREEHNAEVSKSIVDKVEDVASVSLEVLKERIEEERSYIGLKTVTDVCSITLKALGFGVKSDNSPANSQVNVFVGADQETLHNAREKMRLINQMPREAGSREASLASETEVIEHEKEEPLTQPLPTAS